MFMLHFFFPTYLPLIVCAHYFLCNFYLGDYFIIKQKKFVGLEVKNLMPKPIFPRTKKLSQLLLKRICKQKQREQIIGGNWVLFFLEFYSRGFMYLWMFFMLSSAKFLGFQYSTFCTNLIHAFNFLVRKKGRQVE
eukprot:TRINITY_DN28100_c0_g2_i2.p4 TRINITY_DN28100_c0_g2~~TRINITY_DN28100_c0_g2_i2.p4  ORF type:complete len:135 (-),score=7.86 TRINITY_DN28100_c0_g2_i2:450-854(-)